MDDGLSDRIPITLLLAQLGVFPGTAAPVPAERVQEPACKIRQPPPFFPSFDISPRPSRMPGNSPSDRRASESHRRARVLLQVRLASPQRLPGSARPLAKGEFGEAH